MPADPLKERVAALWARHLGSAEGLALTPCAVSGNNRVFVARANGQAAIAKWYFAGPKDGRDRLESEWQFLSYAAAAQIACVPRPLARDQAAGLALYELCDGVKPDRATIGPAAIDAAAAFFRALNQPAHRALAARLPPAAEASFSPAGQIALVDGRLQRLAGIPIAAPLDAAAAALVGAMNGYWSRLCRRLPDALAAQGIDPAAELPDRERCISPSDFGFHNALIGPDGTIRFIDFEYGGWDDPVKMVCDFFLQPAVPVDPRHRDRFIAEALGDCWDTEPLAARAGLMQPLFALKWCCIMLNPFVPDLAGRGRFADPSRDENSRKRQRLADASAAFHSLEGR